MTLTISIRDYRGLERADIELSPIALVAGRNEQGKSCLAQAARAALYGTAVPLPNVAKKDAQLLVRDGAKEGHATATLGDLSCKIEWPRATEKVAEAGAPKCSEFATGLMHILDLDAKARANALATYIDSAPTKADLAAAMADVGYSEAAVEQTWLAVSEPGGWDSTYKKAREHTTKLKGAWEQVTGEKYGSKKAENWKNDGYPEGATREELEAEVERAKAAVKKAVGAAAVSAADIERLEAEAEAEIPDLDALRKDLEAVEAELAEVQAERMKLPADIGAGDNAVCDCPSCGAKLVVEHIWNGPTVLKPYDEDEAKKATSKEVGRRRAELDGRTSNLKGKVASLTHEIARGEAAAKRAEAAKAKLAELAKQEQPDEEKIAEAERREAEALKALRAFEAKAQADKLHGQIVRNDALVTILAPDGLRRRKLAAGLDAFNSGLAKLCEAAGWPAVRFDENLEAHYGTRPLWAASASGQWRARVVIQVAMALLDNSPAVVIDEADILDARGRNGLFKMLPVAGVRALCCMTINKPDLVPNLNAAKLGSAYWIEGGVVEPIGAAKEKAA